MNQQQLEPSGELYKWAGIGFTSTSEEQLLEPPVTVPTVNQLVTKRLTAMKQRLKQLVEQRHSYANDGLMMRNEKSHSYANQFASVGFMATVNGSSAWVTANSKPVGLIHVGEVGFRHG